MTTTLAPLPSRAAQAGPVTIHLDPTGPAYADLYLITVRTNSGPWVDELRRTYDRHTAPQAYANLVALFLAGWTVNAVVDFARTVAPVASDKPERLLPLCEVAA